MVQDPWGRETKFFYSVDITDLSMNWSSPNGAGLEGEQRGLAGWELAWLWVQRLLIQTFPLSSSSKVSVGSEGKAMVIQKQVPLWKDLIKALARNRCVWGCLEEVGSSTGSHL